MRHHPLTPSGPYRDTSDSSRTSAAPRRQAAGGFWAFPVLLLLWLSTATASAALPAAITSAADPLAKIRAIREYVEGPLANQLNDGIYFPTSERRAAAESDVRALLEQFPALVSDANLPRSARAGARTWQAYVQARMGWLLYQDIKNTIARPDSAASVRCQELARHSMEAASAAFTLISEAEAVKTTPAEQPWYAWMRAWSPPIDQKLYEIQTQANDLLWLLTRDSQYQERARDLWNNKLTADYKLASGAQPPAALAPTIIPPPAGVPPWMIALGGVLLLLLVLTILIRFRDLPPDARSVARLIAAVGVAYAGTVFTGSLQVTWQQIAAGTGTFALFLLCFLWNPASGARRGRDDPPARPAKPAKPARRKKRD